MKKKPGKKGRKREITWWNPPYNASVATNVIKIFLAMVDQHFPKGTLLHQIFNRSTLKAAYRTGKNVKQIIDAHNKNILSEGQNKEPVAKCNCRSSCPVEGNCQTKNVAYLCKATHTDDNGNPMAETQKYNGQTGRAFKERYKEHMYSLSTPKKELIRKDKNTGEKKVVTIKEQIEERKEKSELANYVWSLKEQGKKFSLEWSIVKKAFNYKNGQRFCDLCATETTLIALGDPATTLNKRSEIFHKCRYKARFKLQAFLSKPP